MRQRERDRGRHTLTPLSMDKLSLDIHPVGHTLYPALYRQASFIRFPMLPNEISVIIHQCRRLEDMKLPEEEVMHLLGFGESTEKDQTLISLVDDIVEFQRPTFAFSDDTQVMRLAIAHVSWAYSYASDRLRNDKELMLFALSQDGFALGYGSTVLQDDEDVIRAAFERNPFSLCFASERLQAKYTSEQNAT